MWYKRVFGLKRYFIVGYSFSMGGNSWGSGVVWIFTRDGYFINSESVIKHLTEDINKKYNIQTDVVLNSIMELSRADYETFTRKHENKDKQNDIEI